LRIQSGALVHADQRIDLVYTVLAQGCIVMRTDKALNATPEFLIKLRDEGRIRADAWLVKNGGLLGRRSSLDLNAFV
jgi:hypothetical protein